MKYEPKSFIVIPNRHKLHELTPGALAVYIHLCDFADMNGVCFPSRATLAKRIGMHVNSVDRFIEEIEKKGLISKSKRVNSDGGMTSNSYQLLVVSTTTHGEPPLTTHSEGTKPIINEKTADADFLEIKEEKIDSNGNSVSSREKMKPANSQYEELCLWAEKRRGFPFVNRKKQYAALKKAREMGISISKLKQRWIEMEDEQWRNGYDWTGGVNSFDRKS